ncbi:MAG: zinc ribbon domain-containing protein [Lachnospiraceae bacterium]|nr:zinc ribbon domain-containing protein [Lachnospiraceae bacterium]
MDFFDKLGDTLINAGKDVSKKAKDLSGTAKLNMDIKSKEDFIQKQYTEIGRLYYEAHSKEADAEFAQQMAIVTEAYEAIAKMRDEVLKIKGARVCPNCGSPVPDTAGFCGKCGTPLNQMPPQQGNMPQGGPQNPMQ